MATTSFAGAAPSGTITAIVSTPQRVLRSCNKNSRCTFFATANQKPMNSLWNPCFSSTSTPHSTEKLSFESSFVPYSKKGHHSLSKQNFWSRFFLQRQCHKPENFNSSTLRPNARRVFVVCSIKRSPKRLKYLDGVKKVNEPVVLELDPEGGDVSRLHTIVAMVKQGAVGVIPTDTVYAIVCDLKNKAAVDRMYRIKNMNPKKPLSILCRNFQDIDEYTLGFPRGNGQGQTNVFRVAKQLLPGPYTFILKAGKLLPKQCTEFGGSEIAHCAARKSVGVRMPKDFICQSLLSQLDNPLLCTSVTNKEQGHEHYTDPAAIVISYGGPDGVDFVVDAGVRLANPSTVVDMTGDVPFVLRQGKGPVESWMLLQTHDSSEMFTNVKQIVGGKINPYASSSS